MPELEDRLRTALNTMADDLTASDGARDELRRRLDSRRRSRGRAPALAAAAAAVVLAAVAVPIALDRDQGGPGGLTGPAGRAPTSLTTAPPESTEPWEDDWPGYVLPPMSIPLGDPPEDPYLAIAVKEDGAYCWLLLEPGRESPDSPEWCEPNPDLSRDVVASRSASAIAKDLGAPDDLVTRLDDVLVFYAREDVHQLTVRRGDGSETKAPVIAGGPGFMYCTVDFEGPTDGFGYTAYDIDGNVLVEAIT
jgi:hypothetical protein